MIVAQDVFTGVAGKLLFEGLNFTVHPGQRVGVVGRNGVGKSTLFKLLQGSLLPDQGEIRQPPSWRISQLFQQVAPSNRSALDWTIDGDTEVRRIEAEIAEAEAQTEHSVLAALYSRYEDVSGYDVDVRAREILTGLGFSSDDLCRSYAEFSGGWRIRLNLAQTLMRPSDLLLLDEPTNHLDLDAALWLEAYLKRYRGTLMVIAHDRDFLNNLATSILHLENKRATMYKGNYDAFERTRAEQLARQAATYRKQQQQRQRIEQFVSRFRAKATKAKQAQSRLKSLSKLTASAPAHADSPYDFRFPDPTRLSDPLLSLEHSDLGYGEDIVLHDVSLHIRPGDRIGILGSNGGGKSTLLKTLAGHLQLLSGELVRGKHASIGYFAQHQMETLKPNDFPLALLQALSPSVREQAVRNYLGGWGFKGEMSLQPVRKLSGGEKARLVLALLAWQQPALMLLDEPTNHLDLEMRMSLALALQTYQGAIILVSHDRSLLNQVVDDFWLARNGALTHYQGDLGNYTATRVIPTVSTAKQAGAAQSRKRQRQQGARRRQRTQTLRNQINHIEQSIAKQTQQLEILQDKISDPGTYEVASTAELAALMSRQSQQQKILLELEHQWIESQEQLEDLLTAIL